MSERGRINRAIQSAETSFKALISTRNPEKQQAAWEDFLLHWKRSVELLRSYCKANNRDDVRERRFNERIADAKLNYAWEARNAEEHDHLGSADTEEGSVTINPLDKDAPLIIRGLTVSKNMIKMDSMSNGVVCVEDGRLKLKPIVGSGGKRVIDPPSDANPHEICSRALEFVREYYSEVF